MVIVDLSCGEPWWCSIANSWITGAGGFFYFYLKEMWISVDFLWKNLYL